MTTPNQDSADDGSMAGVMKAWLRAYIREHLDDMLPARVVSYDDATNRAVIHPLIMMGTTDGQKVSRAQIVNVPVFRFGGGGFFMRYPIKPGDFGWLKANDRDVSLMFQRGGQEDWPNTERLHSFSDAMFFPDTIKDWAIDGENADALVLQSLDGGVCIALHAGKITMKAPSLEVDIAETIWNGNLTQNGTFAQNGGMTGTGGAAFSGGAVTHNGKDIGSTMRVTGVTAGNDISGVPV